MGTSGAQFSLAVSSDPGISTAATVTSEPRKSTFWYNSHPDPGWSGSASLVKTGVRVPGAAYIMQPLRSLQAVVRAGLSVSRNGMHTFAWLLVEIASARSRQLRSATRSFAVGSSKW